MDRRSCQRPIGQDTRYRGNNIAFVGDADPISPVAVGERLSALLQNASLDVFHGADHDLAQTHTIAVAVEAKCHLTASDADRPSGAPVRMPSRSTIRFSRIET